MAGTEALKAGQLAEAIKQVAGEVRTKPSDLAVRIFYFELLCLSGDVDRAAKQLEVIGVADSELGTGIYHGAIQAEKERRQFFHGGPRPRLIGESPQAGAYLEAVEYYAAGDAASAAKRLQEASEQAVPVAGQLNGRDFTGLTETSDLLGPFLEVVMDGHYTWIPWNAIISLSVPEPRYLRDTVWAPVSLQLTSGGHGEALVFSLYVDSQLKADSVKLGRETTWETDPNEFTLAYGQKVIATDQEDCPLLEIRLLEVASCQ
jgi:type VI secretion system protein ImpE